MVLNGLGRKCMKDRCFLDTNLLIYAWDNTDCSVLYSEDLNPGQQIEGVRIINPFTSEGN